MPRPVSLWREFDDPPTVGLRAYLALMGSCVRGAASGRVDGWGSLVIICAGRLALRGSVALLCARHRMATAEAGVLCAVWRVR